MQLDERFILELGNIKEPEIFLGVARILKVQLLNEKGEVKDFSELCAGAIESFELLKRKRKRELLKILREANARGSANGN